MIRLGGKCDPPRVCLKWQRASVVWLHGDGFEPLFYNVSSLCRCIPPWPTASPTLARDQVSALMSLNLLDYDVQKPIGGAGANVKAPSRVSLM